VSGMLEIFNEGEFGMQEIEKKVEIGFEGRKKIIELVL
jgi:hypothetical protein